LTKLKGYEKNHRHGIGGAADEAVLNRISKNSGPKMAVKNVFFEIPEKFYNRFRTQLQGVLVHKVVLPRTWSVRMSCEASLLLTRQ
jgi:hypothetical protein